jgi:3-oxoadipate enol-lactonase
MKLWHEVTGAGSPVLLIHEGIADSRMWDPQWATFPRVHRTVRCDLRGFGRTAIASGSFSHARDVIELLEGLALGPASLVGASLGGRIALEIALARPDLVDRLVLVDAGLPGHSWSPVVRRYFDEEDAALEEGEIDRAVEATLRMWVDGPNRAPDQVAPQVRQLVGTMQRLGYELQLPVWETADEGLLVPDVADRLDEVRAPTLVLVGSEDVADMHTIAERLATEITGARRAEVSGAAHVPSLERPGEFDALVLPFLRRE